jgi:hypothetical protein
MMTGNSTVVPRGEKVSAVGFLLKGSKNTAKSSKNVKKIR